MKNNNTIFILFVCNLLYFYVDASSEPTVGKKYQSPATELSEQLIETAYDPKMDPKLKALEMESLLQRGASATYTDKNNNNALFYLLMSKNNYQCIKVLTDAKTSLSTRTENKTQEEDDSLKHT